MWAIHDLSIYGLLTNQITKGYKDVQLVSQTLVLAILGL
jgi:hypothetical protein